MRILLALLLIGCAPTKEISELGFSAGVHPVTFRPNDFARATNGEPLETAASCGKCHTVQHANWLKSRHRVAFTNPLYQESHARENMVWCVNCHAPLMKPEGNPPKIEDRLLVEEGISCNVCHVREGKIITSKMPVPTPGNAPAHAYTIIPDMKTEKMCESCHQFNFPTHDSLALSGTQPIKYASLPMQDTVEEWRRGGLSNLSCQSCHLLGGDQSHLFPGGHDLPRVSEAIDLEFQQSGELIKAFVHTRGVAHAFPTGDLFRAVRIRIYDRNDLVHEEILKKDYGNVAPEALVPGGAAKRLVSDTTIAPPGPGEFTSYRTFLFKAVPGKALRYEIYMDYLHGMNHVITRLPLQTTMPLVRTGPVTIGRRLN